MEKLNVIVAEDEPITAMDIENILVDGGYNLLAVFNSAELLLEKIDMLKPDIILMDIILAGTMDGIEAAEEIRKRIDIPVIYLTSHSDKPTLKRAKITQPYGYIIKPVNESEIYSVIETSLYRHGIERKLRENES